MTETMPTSEVLNRAADLIEERGWWDGRHGSGLCASNAIAAATDGALPAFHLAHDALETYLHVSNTPGIFRWNDAQPDGSVVIETLRACAVIEASREREAAEVPA